MAKTEKGKKRNKKKDAAEVSDVPKQPGMFASMKPETVRGIGGVLLFVLGVLLVLAGIPDMAGPLGNVSYQGLFMVFGVGYWLLPIMVAAWALALFKRDYAENKLRPIRTTGALLGFVSLLAILSVVGNERIGGLLGSYTARPLLASLETVATLVILAGLIVVSLLLLLDSELWAKIFEKVFSIFKRKKEEPQTILEDEHAEDDKDEEQPEATDDEPYTAPVQQTTDVPSVVPPKHEEPVREPSQKMPPLETFDDVDTAPALATYQPPSEYKAPPLSYLEQDSGKPNAGNTKQRSNLIQQTLRHFKIPVEMDEIVVGPAVTRFALKPAEGVKLQRITNLKQNLEMALEAHPIRIEAPIPGRSLVGIEVPNTGRSLVGLAGLLASPKFAESNKHLLVALGKDITGGMHFADIADLPHLLIAGATKSGKSVMVHTLINSLLYRNGPTQLRLILVDPKQVELTLYENLPHLLTPVITDAKKAIRALMWAGKEMENRYEQLRAHKVRDIGEYLSTVYHPALEAMPETANDLGADGDDDAGETTPTSTQMPLAMPHIVVIIDELADIMQAYPRELEGAIVKLAQKSRAVGIHLVLSTQSPRADVVTGIIKANMPARMALKVTSGTESRIILDDMGAEQLLGNGDMLWKAPDMSKPRRIQSPFVSSAEVKKIVAYITNNNTGDLTNILPDPAESEGGGESGGFGGDDVDDLYEQVREYVIQERRASTSLIQRRFKVGYGRAARIMDQLEERGIIEKSDGTNRPRMLRPEYGGGAMGDGVEGE